MTTEPTYDTPPRTTETVTVRKRTISDTGYLTVTWSNGWSFAPPREQAEALVEGTDVVVETIKFNQITGLQVDGRWLYRLSDQDLDLEYVEFVSANAKRDEEFLAKNRTALETRTAALPGWLRDRLQGFIDDPVDGASFQLRDWGYELAASEVAALYEQHGEGELSGPDPEPVMAYARDHGTTGFQHSWAKAAVRGHRAEVAANEGAAS
jgi:hypothetical protein